uniref:Protein kinase domain-containing protein n=1 Tax=Parastrongyloides trichosuri TaxID=131310 RepID=A0A0N4ZMY4_PARTI
MDVSNSNYTQSQNVDEEKELNSNLERVRLQYNFNEICYNSNGDFILKFKYDVNGKKLSYGNLLSGKIISKNGIKVIKDIEYELKKGSLRKKSSKFCSIKGYGFSNELQRNILAMPIYIDYISGIRHRELRSKNEYRAIFKGMLSALSYLHNAGFVHGNLNGKSFWYDRQPIGIERDEETTKTVLCVRLCDIDQVCRWNKNDYLNNLEKKDSELKKIYEERMKKKNYNFAYCSLKQHVENHRSMKGDLESWFYLCIVAMDKLLGWKDLTRDEESAYLEKLNVRKATYSKYTKIGIIFSEIINIIDNMNENEIPDHNKILEMVDLSFKYDEDIMKNFNITKNIETTTFMEMALEYRLRLKNFNNYNDRKMDEIEEEIASIEKRTDGCNNKTVTKNNTAIGLPSKVNIKKFINTKSEKKKNKNIFESIKQRISKFF